MQSPNDADLLELLYRYAPDDAELQKILVANPARLFGFDNWGRAEISELQSVHQDEQPFKKLSPI